MEQQIEEQQQPTVMQSSQSASKISQNDIVIIKLLKVFGKLFNKIDEYFAINSGTLIDNLLQQLGDQEETSTSNSSTLTVRTKFVDLLTNQFTKELQQKYNSFDENLKNQKQLQAQFETTMYRVKNIEKNLQGFEIELKEKEPANDAKEKREALLNQLYGIQAYMQSQVKLCAEKVEFQKLSTQVYEMEARLLKKIDKDVYMKDQDNRDELMTDKIQDYVAKKYAAKAEISEILKKNQKDIDSASANLKLLKHQFKDRMGKMEVDVKVHEQLISERTTIEDFTKFKEYSAQYVHKTDIDHMYSIIIPKVNDMQKQVENMLKEVADFKRFLNKTDYDVLFKASKMDLEQLNRKYEEQNSTMQRVLQQMSENNTTIDTMKHFINKFYDENTRSITDKVRKLIVGDLQSKITQEVHQTFADFKVKDIGSQVSELMQKINLKADVADLIEVLDTKTSKQSVNDIINEQRQIILYLSSLCNGSLAIMQYVSTALDRQVVSMKRRELNQIVHDIAQLSAHLKIISSQKDQSLLNKIPDSERFKKPLKLGHKSVTPHENISPRAKNNHLLNESLEHAAEIQKKRLPNHPKPVLRPLQFQQMNDSHMQAQNQSRWTPERLSQTQPFQNKFTAQSKERRVSHSNLIQIQNSPPDSDN